jgi:hypothetical protein
LVFKKRHNIVFRSICGEASEVDIGTVISWKSHLPNLYKNYRPEDVFNADETGLFFRALPNKTLAIKGQECRGGKLAKERLTVLFCASAMGEKLPPLIIGKSKSPRCFKNMRILESGFKWRWNSKAWMTEKIFTQWLQEINNNMRSEKRKIILFIDNVSSHQQIELSNVRIQFFPPNCTSHLQPLDQGIIRAFKVRYRKMLLSRMLQFIDTSERITDLSKRINVLDALNWISRAWGSITKEIITNCFVKAGFIFDITSETLFEVEKYDKLDLQEMAEMIQFSGFNEF